MPFCYVDIVKPLDPQMHMLKKVTLTSRSNCWHRKTLITAAAAACSTLFKQARHMKCVEHQQDITSEEFTGEVQFDIDPKVKVIHNTITF